MHSANQLLSDDPPEVEGFPMRAWDISIYLVGPDGDDVPASCFEKATYLLHESFGKRMRQSMYLVAHLLRTDE